MSVYVPYSMSFIRIHLAISVMLLLLFSYKIYTIILARKKPMQANQSQNLLNSFAVSGGGKDADDRNGGGSNLNDETDKERELKMEIHRLYRQLEEMRSLSMRIANPHLLTKKSRFISYPTKRKEKSSRMKAPFLNSENELSKVLMSTTTNAAANAATTVNANNIQIDGVTIDHPSFIIQNDNPSTVSPK